jgi:hypothetical protein
MPIGRSSDLSFTLFLTGLSSRAQVHLKKKRSSPCNEQGEKYEHGFDLKPDPSWTAHSGLLLVDTHSCLRHWRIRSVPIVIFFAYAIFKHERVRWIRTCQWRNQGCEPVRISDSAPQHDVCDGKSNKPVLTIAKEPQQEGGSN